MAVVFYDILEPTPAEDAPGRVEVERIYGFDWDRFDERHWRELSSIYERLPGPFFDDREVPWWFGTYEEAPAFLSASVEPLGLQVSAPCRMPIGGPGMTGSAPWPPAFP